MSHTSTLLRLTGTAGVLLVGGTVASRLGREPSDAWSASGFVQQADSIIREKRYLRLVCAASDGPAQDSIVADMPAGSSEERFYQLSYLLNDVRMFNSNPAMSPSPFLIDGCDLLGVDPYFHRVALPYATIAQWRGDIRLSGTAVVTTLENGNAPQTLELRHPNDAADASQGTTVSPRARGDVGSALFHIAEPSRRETLADAYYVGQSPVLADRRDEQAGAGSSDTIRMNGYVLPPGRIVRLETGDWLRFSSPLSGRARANGASSVSSTYIATTDRDLRVVSFVRTQNERVSRVITSVPMQPFLQPLGQAIEMTLQGVRGAADEGSRAARMNVQLTLERELGQDLRTATLAECASRPGVVRPRSISVLVMDAFSGEVRGMASCPEAEQLKKFEPMPTQERERWLRSQNLVRHEIGSAGKPFWAAAIASTYPDMLDFQIRSHAAGEATEAAGCKLAAGYGDHAHDGPGGWVGLESYLAQSCNRYVVELATASLTLNQSTECRGQIPSARFAECFQRPATPPPTAVSDQVRICDRVVDIVLSEQSRFVSGKNCDDLQLLGTDWDPARRLESIANVGFYYLNKPDALLGAKGSSSLNPGYRYMRYRADVWRALLDSLHDAGDTAQRIAAGLRFAAVSPEATNMGLNTVEHLRAGWVNLLLGGANSRWSTFQLAEAMSRLLTSRAVVGSFVQAIDVAGEPAAQNRPATMPAFDTLGAAVLHPGVRRRVLHGMELVVDTGTARGIKASVASLRRRLAAIDPGDSYELYAFAKTGTPTVWQYFSSREERVLDSLFSAGVDWDPAASQVLYSPRARAYYDHLGRDANWIRDAVFGPIEAAPDEYRHRPGGSIPEHPVYLEGNRLMRRRTQDARTQGQAGVLVFSLLAVPQSSGRAASRRHADWVASCPIDPGLRDAILSVPPGDELQAKDAVALSVAVHINDLRIGEGSPVAVAFANKLMDVLGPYMERAVKQRVLDRRVAVARR